jgi:uncharacterized Zn finger protein
MKHPHIYLYCPDCGSSEGEGVTPAALVALTDEDELVYRRCENCGEEPPIGDWKVNVWQVRQLLKGEQA